MGGRVKPEMKVKVREEQTERPEGHKGDHAINKDMAEAENTEKGCAKVGGR